MIRAGLVSDDYRHAKKVGEGRRRLGESGVRAADDEVVNAQRLNVFADHRASVKVIDGHTEEALNLRAVQVHREDSVGSGGFNRVRTHASSNRHSGFVLLVTLRIAEVRYDGCNLLGTRAFESVNPE